MQKYSIRIVDDVEDTYLFPGATNIEIVGGTVLITDSEGETHKHILAGLNEVHLELVFD